MRIRVATFNVQHGLRDDGEVVDVDRLADSVAGLDADLVALQEVDVGVRRSGRVDEASAVALRCDMGFVFGAATRVGWRGRYGNALLARGSLEKAEVGKLPRHRRNEPRAVVRAEVHLDAGTVSVAATHLSIRRPEVFDQLRAAVATLDGWPQPRLLLGDFNLEAAEVEPIVSAAGFALVAGEPTFPARSPKARIDHVAVDGFTAVRADVVRTGASDHCAVVVVLETP